MEEITPPNQPPGTPPNPAPPSLPPQPESKKHRRVWPWLLLLLLIVLAPFGYLAYLQLRPQTVKNAEPPKTTGEPEETTMPEESGPLRLIMECTPSNEMTVVPYRTDCRARIAGEGTSEAKNYIASRNGQLTVLAEGVSTNFPYHGGGYQLDIATSHFGSDSRYWQFLAPATIKATFPFKDGEASFSYIYAGGATGDNFSLRGSIDLPEDKLEDAVTVAVKDDSVAQVRKGAFYYDVATNKSSLTKGNVFDLKITITARDSRTDQIYDRPYQAVYVIFSPARKRLVEYDGECMGRLIPSQRWEFYPPVEWNAPMSNSDSASCTPLMKDDLQGYEYSPYPYAYFPVILINGVGSITVQFNGDQAFDESQVTFVVTPGDYVSLFSKCSETASQTDCKSQPATPRKPAGTSFLYLNWMENDNIAYRIFSRVVTPIR